MVAMKNSIWEFLKKLTIESPYNPEISLLGIYPKRLKQDLREIFAYPCSLWHHSQQPRGGSNLDVHRERNKENVVQAYNRILFSLKKRKEILTHRQWR